MSTIIKLNSSKGLVRFGLEDMAEHDLLRWLRSPRGYNHKSIILDTPFEKAAAKLYIEKYPSEHVKLAEKIILRHDDTVEVVLRVAPEVSRGFYDEYHAKLVFKKQEQRASSVEKAEDSVLPKNETTEDDAKKKEASDVSTSLIFDIFGNSLSEGDVVFDFSDRTAAGYLIPPHNPDKSVLMDIAEKEKADQKKFKNYTQKLKDRGYAPSPDMFLTTEEKKMREEMGDPVKPVDPIDMDSSLNKETIPDITVGVLQDNPDELARKKEPFVSIDSDNVPVSIGDEVYMHQRHDLKIIPIPAKIIGVDPDRADSSTIQSVSSLLAKLKKFKESGKKEVTWGDLFGLDDENSWDEESFWSDIEKKIPKLLKREDLEDTPENRAMLVSKFKERYTKLEKDFNSSPENILNVDEMIERTERELADVSSKKYPFVQVEFVNPGTGKTEKRVIDPLFLSKKEGGYYINTLIKLSSDMSMEDALVKFAYGLELFLEKNGARHLEVLRG